MPLSLPPYLQPPAIAAAPVAHAWSQGLAMKALGPDSSPLEKQLGALSFRALLGLAAALSEWIHRRFVTVHDDTQLAALSEAVWAASIDFRYLRTDALAFDEDDVSPIHGPLQDTKRLLRWISEIHQEADFGVVRYVRGLAFLVRYVLADDKGFQQWLKAVVARLPALSAPSARVAGAFDVARLKTQPRGAVDDIWGTPLPREAYDPSFDLGIADNALLIDALLIRIAATPNPFLKTPAELAAAGFTGTPYRFPA